MTSSASSSNITPGDGQHRQSLVSSAASDPLGASKTDSGNFLLIVFLALLSSINTTQSLAQTSANVVQKNATLQESINKQMMYINFQMLPANAKTTTINRVNQYNQDRQFQRQNMQSVIITLRQQGQGDMANAQVNVNYLQQNSSELTAVLTVMNTLMQLVNQMIQPK